MKKFISKDDVEYIGNTLFNYYYLKRQEQKLLQESMNLELKKDTESYGLKRNNPSGGGNGCSVHASYATIDYIIRKQAELDNEAYKMKERYVLLDKQNKLMERFRNVSTESQIIINNFYQRGMSIKDIANIEGVTRQTISSRLDIALREMVGADV